MEYLNECLLFKGIIVKPQKREVENEMVYQWNRRDSALHTIADVFLDHFKGPWLFNFQKLVSAFRVSKKGASVLGGILKS
jgi:hypothetical protein